MSKRMQSARHRYRFFASLVVFQLLSPIQGSCQLCDTYARAPIFSSQIQNSPVVVLAEILTRTPVGRAGAMTKTSVKIQRVYKGPQALQSGEILDTYVPEMFVGDSSVLLLGGSSGSDKTTWKQVLRVSDCRLGYLNQRVAFESDQTKRLAYFIPFLESSNRLDDLDASAEFQDQPYEVLIDLVAEFPQSKLREWLHKPRLELQRVNLYAILLGMGGHAEDTQLLQDLLFPPDTRTPTLVNYQQALMGYLLSGGERALEEINVRVLEKSTDGLSVSAALNALQFVWHAAPDRVSRDCIRHSIQIVLNRPQFAALAIWYLSRLRDWEWEWQDRLLAIYGQGEFNQPAIKRAILQYMYDCGKQNLKFAESILAAKASADRAWENLKILQTRDPVLASEFQQAIRKRVSQQGGTFRSKKHRSAK